MATAALAVLVTALLGLGLGLTLFGMPGNWLMVLVIAASSYWGGAAVSVLPPVEGAQSHHQWLYPLVAFALAAAGEIIEFVSAAAGVRLGGSRRGAWLAVLGAFLGSIVGGFMGLPVPVFGSIIGIVFGSCLGATAGATIGELSLGRPLGVSLRLGAAAFRGRLFGLGCKFGCAVAIFFVGLSQLVFG